MKFVLNKTVNIHRIREKIIPDGSFEFFSCPGQMSFNSKYLCFIISDSNEYMQDSFYIFNLVDLLKQAYLEKKRSRVLEVEPLTCIPCG